MDVVHGITLMIQKPVAQTYAGSHVLFIQKFGKKKKIKIGEVLKTPILQLSFIWGVGGVLYRGRDGRKMRLQN